MTEETDASGSTDPERDPSDQFALVADETRLSILRALAAERRQNWQRQGLGFAELRQAVGVRDSGQFNYHLDKLVGRFVVREGDEYVITTNGMELVGAVEAGRYADVGGAERTEETDYECVRDGCDRSLVARYENHAFELRCPEHDLFQRSTLPPGPVAHKSLEELVAVADDRSRHELAKAQNGVCPHCWGPVDATVPVREVPSMTGETTPPEAVFVQFTCDHCDATIALPPGVCVLDHPAVISLYHEHGRDYREVPALTLPFLNALHPEVESTDPARVRVDVEVGDDRLSLWLGDNATVAEYERE